MAPASAPKTELTIRRTVDVPGYTKEQIYDEAKAWSIKEFKKAAEIQRADREAGVFITKGATSYPSSWTRLFSPKIRHDVFFRMKVEAQDDVFHLTFDDLRTYSVSVVSQYGATTKEDGALWRQEDLDKIKPKLLEFGDEIAEAISRLEKLPPRETVETVKTPADVPISEKDDRYTELMKLKKLLDEGIITQEEYDIEKKEILEKY
jgi:hypothetical protein